MQCAPACQAGWPELAGDGTGLRWQADETLRKAVLISANYEHSCANTHCSPDTGSYRSDSGLPDLEFVKTDNHEEAVFFTQGSH